MRVKGKHIVKIDSNGKIKLPVEIAEKITKTTEYLELTVEDNKIILKPVKISIEEVDGLVDISTKEVK